MNIGFSVGLITIFISIAVLFLWFPLKQKPGIGTILNALIIGLMIDVCIRYVPTPENYLNQILLGAIAVVTVGLGGGIYLVANLGPGPRDGLMIGLQKKTNFPIASVRAFLEISVMSVGWYLGGTVGIGTLLFAFGIGPCVALSLFLVGLDGLNQLYFIRGTINKPLASRFNQNKPGCSGDHFFVQFHGVQNVFRIKFRWHAQRQVECFQ